MRISDWSSDVCSSDLFTQLFMRSALCTDEAHDFTFDIAGLDRMFGDIDVAGMQFLHARDGDASRNPDAGQPEAHASLRSVRFRSEEHTSELQSLMRTSYAVFCLKKNNNTTNQSPTI